MCSYDCPNPSKWIVNARRKEAALFVCGVHLSKAVAEQAVFNDPRYKSRSQDDGVRIFPITR
jgi:hypothetical protein